jgi:hypothetical protein
MLSWVVSSFGVFLGVELESLLTGVGGSRIVRRRKVRVTKIPSEVNRWNGRPRYLADRQGWKPDTLTAIRARMFDMKVAGLGDTEEYRALEADLKAWAYPAQDIHWDGL